MVGTIMSFIAANPPKPRPNALPKNDIFQSAKREIANIETAGIHLVEQEGVDEGTLRMFEGNMTDETSLTTLTLIDAALQMVYPEARVMCDIDTQKIHLVLPASCDELPVQQVQENIGCIRRALVKSVTQAADGSYHVYPAKDLGTLNMQAFLGTLINEHLEDPTKAKLASEPEFDCHYIVNQGKAHALLLDSKEFEGLNVLHRQKKQPEYRASECFHHAELNDAAMSILDAAISVRSKSATLH